MGSELARPCRPSGAERRRTRQHGARLRQAARACGLAFLAGATSTGCYVYNPIPAGAAPQAHVALDLNDRGQVVLADSVGPGPVRIEGLVESLRDSTYQLRVSSVRYMGGETARWANEPLGVPASLVRSVSERRLSRGRTVLISAGVVGAVLAFALSRDLFGEGSNVVDRPPTEPGTGNQ